MTREQKLEKMLRAALYQFESLANRTTDYSRQEATFYPPRHYKTPREMIVQITAALEAGA